MVLIQIFEHKKCFIRFQNLAGLEVKHIFEEKMLAAFCRVFVWNYSVFFVSLFFKV